MAQSILIVDDEKEIVSMLYCYFSKLGYTVYTATAGNAALKEVEKKPDIILLAFVIFPSNRGGYCIQPQKREYSLHYKCSFPECWLGLEKEELAEASGLESAVFCHKGGFLMTVGELSDAVEACRISLDSFKEEKALVNVGGGDAADELLRELPGMAEAQIYHMPLPELPELEQDGSYGEVAMEKADWKLRNRDYVKQILQYRPEAVYVEGDVFSAYPVVHLLRKKHVPVLAMAERGGERILVRIPSGS